MGFFFRQLYIIMVHLSDVALFAAYGVMMLLSIVLFSVEQHKPSHNRRMWSAGMAFFVLSNVLLLARMVVCLRARGPTISRSTFAPVVERFVNPPGGCGCGA